MSILERLTSVVSRRSKVVIVVLLLLTLAIGSGAAQVEQSSGLDQFQSDTTEAQKLDYVRSNFTALDRNTTQLQVIVRDDDGNVLSKDSLLQSLEFQQAIRANRTINRTLAENRPILGISNLVVIGHETRELARLGQQFQQLNATVAQERQALQADQRALAERHTELNATVDELQAALNRTARLQVRYDRLNATYEDKDNESYQRRAAAIEAELDDVRQNTTTDLPIDLSQNQTATFVRAMGMVRAAETPEERRQAFRLGTQGVLEAEFADLKQRGQELAARGEALAEKGERLKELGTQLQEKQQRLQDGIPISRQEEILRGMNATTLDATLTELLSKESTMPGSEFAFRLMQTSYEPGSTEASARMLFITQVTGGSSAVSSGQSLSDEVVDAQLGIQRIADENEGSEYIVFGFGVISQEIDQSMTDSLAIVGPLALVFVLLTLIIAYRDLLDIFLGFVGIFAVLMWTFGFMGWLGISFNQIMIAVPVLLIGLSIDYAIHIFMRHREQRMDDDVTDDVGGSMQVALAGVGMALIWVTATTVIGFMSNVISPLPPIRDFGVVSSFGIVAALLIFGALVPALKIELDSLLEGFGFDRKKRAFGTGGGRFSQALAFGSTAARRAAPVVIVLVLLVTVAGAYGGSQVSTTFSQEDFLAEDPPNWMEDLPEPFAPSEYTAKQHLEYVNDNFQRQDVIAVVLVEGSVTDDDTLERLHEARDLAGEQSTTYVASDGQPSISGPISLMEQVANRNETFYDVWSRADTDGNGVPDRNLAQVYDAFFAAAPDQAGDVVYRKDGDYEAIVMRVSLKGGASTDTVTTEMRDVAAVVDGDGLTATATGDPVVGQIVQDQLLDTVIESLVITLVAVFAFLMVAYRVTDGSALLGAVTLLPVALTVAWILGTMKLLGIPFNVLTGTITSLTVGLGVAYSIHVSERYNLELERQGAVWPAMRTAVTGTGGALLGSAATTVGGFGVLSLAILPPLQQFGIITGITIVYAFLASVLVLPTFLVVWTRYAGPDDVDFETTPDDGGPTAPAGDESADEGVTATTGDEGPTHDDGTRVPEAGTDDGVSASVANGSGQVLAAGSAADSAVTDAGDGPVRTVRPEDPAPGEEFSVVLTVPSAAGRVVLRERVPGVGGRVHAYTPSPTHVTRLGRTMYAVWDLDDPTSIQVRYSARANEDGEPLSFDGALTTSQGERPVVDLPAEATAFVERVLGGDPVTVDDLRTAAEYAADGDLTEAQLRAIYARWTESNDGNEEP